MLLIYVSEVQQIEQFPFPSLISLSDSFPKQLGPAFMVPRLGGISEGYLQQSVL